MDELAGEDDFPPVRVGIHTGPALASGGDWYGRAVNVAARLCATAPGGEVMVSEHTRTAAGSLNGVEWGARELHWLRNVSQPIAAYCAAPGRESVRAPRWRFKAVSADAGRQLLARACPVGLHGEATA